MIGKRLGIVLGLILALGAASAPAAQAGTDNQYQGRVEGDGNTYFGFDLAKKNGEVRVENVQAALAYTCEDSGDGGYALAKGKGSIKAKPDKSFSGKLRITSFLSRGGEVAPGSSYAIKGHLPKHGKANGTVDGELVFANTNRGGSTSVCYTGRVDWKVRKGPLLPNRAHGRSLR